MQWNDIFRWLSDHSGVPMLLVFLVLVAGAYWPGRRAKLEHHAQIPLRDDQ
jgi:cbb3-type cytochrome oxidase subunit 3